MLNRHQRWLFSKNAIIQLSLHRYSQQTKAHRKKITHHSSIVNTPSETITETLPKSFRKTLKSYKTLSKWNLSCLNGFVTASAAFICSGGSLLVTIPSTIGCISLATSACALNQLQEREFDSLMNRTKYKRPLCNGQLTTRQAQYFIFSSLGFGLFILDTYCGRAASLIGLATVCTYNMVYTPLKRKTPYNTEFGAIVGALPPQIGIASSHYLEDQTQTILQVLNATVNDPLSWLTFVLLFTWQMPHFLYLCIRNKNDYILGGFKMWSSFDDDINSKCRRKSLFYSGMLLPLPFLLSYTNITSFMFAIDGSALTMLYFYSVYKWNFMYDSKAQDVERNKCGKYSFYYNLMYLPMFLFLMIIHSKRWKYKKGEFCAIHLAWLQNIGVEYCLWMDEQSKEVSIQESDLPEYIIACNSPFRNEIHFEKPLETLDIADD